MSRIQAALSNELAVIPGRIAVVGPCASGKSTLVACLCQRGYDARQCGQEHSGVHDMWRRLTRPEILVFLDVSPDIAMTRRHMGFYDLIVHRQQERLAHARQHADIVVDTDFLSPAQVCKVVLDYLGFSKAIPRETL